MANPLTILLGIGDLLASFALVIPSMPPGMAIPAAFYLIIKGGIFAAMGDKVSIIDILCGIYLFGVVNGFGNIFVSVIAGLWLLQKAVFSFR